MPRPPARHLRRALLHLALAAAAAALAASPAAAQGDRRARAPAPQDPAADREAVRRAALDYIEGFYEGDSTKHVRSIRRDFHKYGFYWNPDSARYVGDRMTWEEAMAFDRRVRTGNRPAPAGSPKEVQLLDVADQTAAAKVTAWWGIDYILLGRFDGRWMITHVLWQSPPPK